MECISKQWNVFILAVARKKWMKCSKIMTRNVRKQGTIINKKVKNVVVGRNGDRLSTVSYTHLDVYKRQPLSQQVKKHA